MDLFEKRLVSNQLVLDVVYDSSNFDDPERRRLYCGQVVIDHYGKNVPKPAHGSVRLENFTCSPAILIKTAGQLYDSIADKNLLVRRFTVAAGNTQYRKWIEEADAACMKQPDLFENQEEAEKRAAAQKASGEKEMKQLQAILEIRDKWGKNAIVKGMNLLEGATMKERNNQIGGHRM